MLLITNLIPGVQKLCTRAEKLNSSTLLLSASHSFSVHYLYISQGFLIMYLILIAQDITNLLFIMGKLYFAQCNKCGPGGLGCRIHRLHLCRRVRLLPTSVRWPSRWGCRIHWLHLYRGVRLPPTTNECPRYDVKRSNVVLQ